MLPLQARMDLGAIAMKGYSTFPKAPAFLEPHLHPEHSLVGRVLPSAEKQLMYFTAPADWETKGRYQINKININIDRYKQILEC